jgi:hypothetical protein
MVEICWKFQYPLWLTFPVQVATRSKAWVCDRSLAEIAGSNPTGGMNVCCECCVMSGRGLCVGLITLPEKSYRVWCVWVWSWILDNEETMVHWGLLCHGRKMVNLNCVYMCYTVIYITQIHPFIHSFIQYSVWRQVQSILQNDSSTQCDLELPPSNESILSCP